MALALPLFGQEFDYLIRNGRVIDGSGNPWIYADVGIIGDRIVFMGKADPTLVAKRTIDAKGLIVAPGFIDMLGQSESNLLIDKQAVSKLRRASLLRSPAKATPSLPPTTSSTRSTRTIYQHFHITPDWIAGGIL